jgi:hypothetical protein
LASTLMHIVVASLIMSFSFPPLNYQQMFRFSNH